MEVLRWRPSYLLGCQTELCYFYLLGQAGPPVEPNNTQLSSPHLTSHHSNTAHQSGAQRNEFLNFRLFPFENNFRHKSSLFLFSFIRLWVLSCICFFSF